MKQRKVSNEMMLQAIFACYLYGVFKIILFKFSTIDIPYLWHLFQRNVGNPAYIKNRLQTANFKPFVSITSNIQNLSEHDLINLFGNIAVFMPYGIFLVLMSNHKKISMVGVFIRSLALSLSLESLQVILSMGNFDVDDLILNSLGGLLGVWISISSRKVLRKNRFLSVFSSFQNISKRSNV